MSAARGAVTLLAIAALAAPGTAFAQGGLGPRPPSPPSSGGGKAPSKKTHKGGSRPQLPAASGGLPHTGLDVPGIALLGLGLMVSGAGLRLRTLDERVF
jgi:hypothetical protein